MTLNTSFQPLLVHKVSYEKSAKNLMDTPLLVTVSFSLAAVKIHSLSLTFGILIMMCLVVALFESNLFGTLCLPGLGSLFPLPPCVFVSLDRAALTPRVSAPVTL